MTNGEYKVGINFNPRAGNLVDKIKRASADLIDLIELVEVGEIAERGRLKALAMTEVENGAMWAVKAATKPAKN